MLNILELPLYNIAISLTDDGRFFLISKFSLNSSSLNNKDFPFPF